MIMLIASITDENPFAIRDCVWMRVDCGRKCRIRRVVGNLLFEGNGQLTGRINIPEQDFCERLPAVLSGIEGLDERGHLIDPEGRIKVPTSKEFYNRPGIVNRFYG